VRVHLESGDLVLDDVFRGLVGGHPLGNGVGAKVVGHDLYRRLGLGLVQDLYTTYVFTIRKERIGKEIENCI
jgi:hypothetical protein